MTLKEKIESVPTPQRAAFILGLTTKLDEPNPYKGSKKWGYSFFNAFEKGRTYVKMNGEIIKQLDLWK